MSHKVLRQSGGSYSQVMFIISLGSGLHNTVYGLPQMRRPSLFRDSFQCCFFWVGWRKPMYFSRGTFEFIFLKTKNFF